MAIRKSSRRAGRRGTSGATEVFRRRGPGPVRQVVCLLIRLRVELAVSAVLFAAWLWLYVRVSPTVSYLAPSGVFIGLMAWPASRRYLVRRSWAVLTRHRLRACMVQIRTMNYDGLLPWMIWSRPTPVGERVWLWMRPGISIDDIVGRTEHLAVSCWARDARVERSRRLAALVKVDVIRRDPLTAKDAAIESPLTLVGKDGPKPPPVAVSAHPRADLQVVPNEPESDSSSRTKSRKTNRTDIPAPGIVVNGEDISDYVD